MIEYRSFTGGIFETNCYALKAPEGWMLFDAPDGEAISFHVWPGAHEGSYWRSHWNEYLRFYADALARC